MDRRELRQREPPDGKGNMILYGDTFCCNAIYGSNADTSSIVVNGVDPGR
jgi:hypothetical protein